MSPTRQEYHKTYVDVHHRKLSESDVSEQMMAVVLFSCYCDMKFKNETFPEID